MLRRLSLQGFKTFASRTVFELEPGITAIVGPNGSGKSNLAEAVRWVLGEQSLRALRSRRTEDVIFAGGPRRPPAGMSEVVVTLDNSTGRLALPFAEVSIARRAYRSGENEYLVNGERARLRDVSDLLSRAGLSANGHVVVGQGLVDTALSLRPEERRTLFEEAAAISHHQARLAESRERLAQTEQNLVRAADIAAEIAPRLPTLARQAARARQALALRAELDGLLVDWYSHLWRELQARTARFAQEAASAGAAVAAARRDLAELEAQAADLARSRTALRSEVDDLRRRAAELGQAREGFRQGLAATRERQRGLAARIEETARDLADLEATRDGEATAVADGREALAVLEARLGSLAERLAAEDAGAAQRLARRRTLQAQGRSAQEAAATAGAALAAARASLRPLRDRRSGVEARLGDLRRVEAEAAEVAGRVQARRGQLEEELRRLAEEQEALAAERARADEALAAAHARQQALAAEADDLERQAKHLEARRDLLIGWRDSQSGYYSGVRAVLQAARRREGRRGEVRLAGIVGPVGELIQVPPQLETAIEVALGAHLQDVVVERWQDAEAAIALLKASGAGRATFLPLDTIRASPAGRAPVDGTGVLGVARQLVTYEPRLAAVVDNLLGHTLVVDDLPVARRVLPQLSGGWQIVTLGGEIVRASGAITGGSSAGASRGILARERELRRLPEEIASLAARLTKAGEALAAARAEEQETAALLGQLRRRDQEVAAARREREEALGAQRQEEAAQEQARRWRAAEERRLAEELARLDEQAAELAAAVAKAEAASAAAQAEVERRRAELAAAEDEDRQLGLQFAELRAARASAEQELRDAGQAQARREAALVRLAEQASERRNRLADLRRAEAELGERIRADEAQVAAAESHLADLAREIGSREVALAEVESRLRAVEVGREEVRGRLQTAQDQERRAALDLERQRVEKAGLLRQVELDLGPAEEVDGTLRAQVAGAVVALDRAPTDDGSLAARIQELRRKLRVVGSANPEAIEEYDQALSRHDFLTGQARDLEQAATSLRQAIAELQDTMRQRFLSTFAAVGEAFQRNFVRLFGGGSASLTLTDPDNPEAAGVDITVQLPGRRARGLGQLSGGERALTAVALIFALLEVNPTPFCVFDEVDAALDEANIGRFCDLLRERSALTQFLVITHNRRTMEAAQALYGLSMEDRSVSRVFSLRLADVAN